MMKMLRKHDSTRRSGFTLIELLAVIVIIGVLAGMISTAVMMAKKKSLEVARETELAMIKSALEAYRFEYQEWPCPATEQNPLPDSATYKDDNNVVIRDWLMKVDAGENQRNSRGIKFLNLGDYRQDSSGNLVDYDENTYKITFDFANDKVSVN